MVSNGPKYRVLVTDFVWPSTQPEREVLAGIGAEIIEAPDGSEDTLASLAVNVDAIMTCFAQVTSKVVEAAGKCQVISRYGVGVDNIAVDTATSEGIVVTYLPDYCVDEVSDHVIALMMAWNRQIQFYDGIAKDGRWEGVRSPVPLVRLRGQTMGIIGFGRIGRAVAAKAHALGLDVLAYDPYLPEGAAVPAGVRPVDLPTLLSRSDFVTVHTPLNEDTRGLIGAEAFATMEAQRVRNQLRQGADNRRSSPLRRSSGRSYRWSRAGRDGAGASSCRPPAVHIEQRSGNAPRRISVPAVGLGIGGAYRPSDR